MKLIALKGKGTSIFTLITMFLLIVLGYFIIHISNHEPYFVFMQDSSVDRCQMNQEIELAKSYSYKHEYEKFGSIKFWGKNKTNEQMDNELVANRHFSYAVKKDNILKKCQLHNVRYHVANVNEKLAPNIPDNVDYIDYHPTKDKAMYCSYKNDELGGSDCTFMKIEDKKIAKYDMSDMERLMIDEIYASQRGRYKTRTDLKYVHSYVAEWDDKMPLPFGFALVTEYQGYLQHWKRF